MDRALQNRDSRNSLLNIERTGGRVTWTIIPMLNWGALCSFLARVLPRTIRRRSSKGFTPMGRDVSRTDPRWHRRGEREKPGWGGEGWGRDFWGRKRGPGGKD